MAEDYQTSLRFSLKEAVWFKKGQEVADLLSIELNPQIGIEEKEDYVQVRGTLELYGEYNEKEEEEETTFSLRDLSQTATVEEVIEREDGVYVFTHYFPIDITIPKKRVKELEDIYILVDSFDYELPESNNLQIMADISITGLYEGDQEEEREMEEVMEEGSDGKLLENQDEVLKEESQNEPTEMKESIPNLYYQTMIENVFKEFSFEARKAAVEEVEMEQEKEESEYQNQEEQEEQKQEEYELQSQRGYEEQGQEEGEVQEQEGYEEQEEQEEYELQSQRGYGEKEQVNGGVQRQEEFEEEQDLQNHGGYKEQEQEEFELQNQRGYEEQEKRENTPHIEFFSHHTEEEEQEQEMEQESGQQEDYVEEELKVEVTVPRSENELYLTKLFGREEESFKKVRIYIVQNGDTLESIAEKYELQVQQITRRNQLDDFYLTEGQILYLPVKKSK